MKRHADRNSQGARYLNAANKKSAGSTAFNSLMYTRDKLSGESHSKSTGSGYSDAKLSLKFRENLKRDDEAVFSLEVSPTDGNSTRIQSGGKPSRPGIIPRVSDDLDDLFSGDIDKLRRPQSAPTSSAGTIVTIPTFNRAASQQPPAHTRFKANKRTSKSIKVAEPVLKKQKAVKERPVEHRVGQTAQAPLVLDDSDDEEAAANEPRESKAFHLTRLVVGDRHYEETASEASIKFSKEDALVISVPGEKDRTVTLSDIKFFLFFEVRSYLCVETKSQLSTTAKCHDAVVGDVAIRNRIVMKVNDGASFYAALTGREKWKQRLYLHNSDNEANALLTEGPSGWFTEEENYAAACGAPETPTPASTRSSRRKKQWQDAAAAAQVILVYPPNQRDSVSLHLSDLNCLGPDLFLNDNILDLFFHYLSQRVLTDDNREHFHIFNTFFYKKLVERTSSLQTFGSTAINYEGVRKWTRNVDIFARRYVLVPINECSHWRIALIFNLPALIESLRAKRANGGGGDATAEVVGGANAANGIVDGCSAPMPDDLSVDSPRRAASGEDVSGTRSAAAHEKFRTGSGKRAKAHTSTRSSRSASAAPDVDSAHVSPDMAAADAKVEAEEDSNAYIYVFDSMSSGVGRAAKTIRAYLIAEWADKHKDEPDLTFDAEMVKARGLKVPQQTNGSDCGLFVLHYAQLLCESPPPDSAALKRVCTRSWFPVVHATHKRESLKKLIAKLASGEADATLPLPPSAPPETNEKEAVVDVDAKADGAAPHNRRKKINADVIVDDSDVNGTDDAPMEPLKKRQRRLSTRAKESTEQGAAADASTHDAAPPRDDGDEYVESGDNTAVSVSSDEQLVGNLAMSPSKSPSRKRRTRTMEDFLSPSPGSATNAKRGDGDDGDASGGRRRGAAATRPATRKATVKAVASQQKKKRSQAKRSTKRKGAVVVADPLQSKFRPDGSLDTPKKKKKVNETISLSDDDAHGASNGGAEARDAAAAKSGSGKDDEFEEAMPEVVYNDGIALRTRRSVNVKVIVHHDDDDDGTVTDRIEEIESGEAAAPRMTTRSASKEDIIDDSDLDQDRRALTSAGGRARKPKKKLVGDVPNTFDEGSVRADVNKPKRNATSGRAHSSTKSKASKACKGESKVVAVERSGGVITIDDADDDDADGGGGGGGGDVRMGTLRPRSPKKKNKNPFNLEDTK